MNLLDAIDHLTREEGESNKVHLGRSECGVARRPSAVASIHDLTVHSTPTCLVGSLGGLHTLAQSHTHGHMAHNRFQAWYPPPSLSSLRLRTQFILSTFIGH